MITLRELATMLAALFYWRDEITPHGDNSARPYLNEVGMSGMQPLDADEIERLSAKLRSLPISE